MLDREACERRVYRLATLLTGDPVAAARVIERVVGAQPDLRHMDSAHMDRLTVLRSREIKPAILVHEVLDHGGAEVLAKLPVQAREAWVLAHVYQAPGREIARAMDCSFTATRRHLAGAEEAIARRMGDDVGKFERAMLAYSMSLDVPKFYRLQQMRRRQSRIALLVLAGAVIASALAALIVWWSQDMGR